MEKTTHLRIVPHLDTSPNSLVFDVIERDLHNDTVLKIGRFTDRFHNLDRITFRSKVVSRGHAEIFIENNQFYIRDTRSSSGTFVNRARLSPPNQESKPFLLHHGDVIQLGVDYQGGIEDEDEIDECCICLYAIAPFQALFVAPCSHSFHFKCCYPLLQNYPGFTCPLCRSYADLNANVAIDTEEAIII
ncbi:hypothetical protein INT48_006724 [Thamnidium elegans]|uniref:Uncharacterized protein n=1 Tax=Thamnidium elegans TaxID=101142 RepID=A0A8H7SUY5_9FUNG|nr:hypothetical protein INT48_006724 [Thamnidium elegans]